MGTQQEQRRRAATQLPGTDSLDEFDPLHPTFKVRLPLFLIINHNSNIDLLYILYTYLLYRSLGIMITR